MATGAHGETGVLAVQHVTVESPTDIEIVLAHHQPTMEKNVKESLKRSLHATLKNVRERSAQMIRSGTNAPIKNVR